MGTEISERITATVDGKKVVQAYRAFAEPTKPYCISLDYGDKLIAATFEPVVEDDYTTVEEAEADNRTQIHQWVDTLAELVEKANLWDDFVNDIDSIDIGDATPVGNCLVYDITDRPGEVSDADVIDLPTPYSVQRLGYDDTDSIWTDAQGDRYKFDGESWLIEAGDDDWVEVDGTYLTDFGPYTTTTQDRVPRKVKRLNESERDAVWRFVSETGTVHTYKWDASIEQWIAKDSRVTDGRWNPIGSTGPLLTQNSPNYFTEIKEPTA